MGLDIKQGTFQLQTTTGYQAVTGVGFQPRAVIFWWGGHNTDIVGTNERGSFGVAGDDYWRRYYDATDPSKKYSRSEAHTVPQGGHAWMTRNNQNPTQAAAIHSTSSAILALNSDAGTPTVRARAALANYLADGFDLLVEIRDTNAMEVYYLALGGSDIEEADVVNFLAPAATGVQAYNCVTRDSGSNLVNFTPTFLIACGGGSHNTTPQSNTDAIPHFGAGKSGEQRAVGASNIDAAATSNTRHVIRNDSLLCEAHESRAAFSSFDAGGFSLNWGAIGTTRRNSSVLAIKGALWKTGDYTTPTTAIENSVTGVGFTPRALVMPGSFQTTALNTLGNPYAYGFGARGPTDEAASSGGVQNGAASPTASRAQSKSSLIYQASPAAVLRHEADLASFDADGFTLQHNTVSAAADKAVYIAIGSNLQVGDGASGGIASAEAFGTGVIQSGLVGVGIDSAEAFGTGSIAGPLTQTAGIASGEAFGVGTILGGLQPIPATPEPVWRMLYTDLDGNVIGEIENASARRFSFMLNHPNLISFKLDLRDRLLKEFLSRKTGLILLFRNRSLKMTAELTGAELARGSDNDKALAITATETMWPRFQNRLVGKSREGYAVTTPTAKGAVLTALLDILNFEDDTGLRVGTDTTTNTITGGPWRYKPMIELMQELSGTLNGFDFRQVPANPLGTGITGYLDFTPVIGQTRDNAIFEFGTGKYNVKDYRWVVDRTGLINRAFALPSDFPDSAVLEVASQSDATQITAEGLREAVVSQDLKDYDLRVQLAAEHIAVRKFPMERFFFTPAPNIDLEPLVDYDVGDTIVGRVKEQGVIALNAQVRCYGITVEPNDEGQELVNLTLVDEP